METKYKEIFKLRKLLDHILIPYAFLERDDLNGFQIIYPCTDNPICSVIEHDYSYGADKDLLEIMGLLTEQEKQEDSVKGYLSANDVFYRIKKHFDEEGVIY